MPRCTVDAPTPSLAFSSGTMPRLTPAPASAVAGAPAIPLDRRDLLLLIAIIGLVISCGCKR